MTNTTTTVYVKDGTDVYKKTTTVSYIKINETQLLADKQSKQSQIAKLQADTTRIDTEITEIQSLLDE